MKTNITKDSIQTILKVTHTGKLLDFLYASFPDRSRNSVKSMLEQNQIMIRNKVVTKFNYHLEPGIEVTVLKKSAVPHEVILPRMDLIYEDESFIVIDKECGLLSVAAGKENEDTAFSILNRYVRHKKKNAELYVVHRLDKHTSGIMMFTKNKDFQQKLQDNWEEAVTKRIYYAVAEGSVENDDGEIISWLKENKALVMYSSQTDGDGQKAVTRYHVMKRNAQYSLLKVELETGRKNQIRVHLKDIGHSVAGDKKYGAKTDPLRRLALHAGILEFSHPLTGESMHFETPVPALFKKLFTV